MLENAKFVLEVRQDRKAELSEKIIIALIAAEVLVHLWNPFLPMMVTWLGGGLT
jgi:hypothetical protein